MPALTATRAAAKRGVLLGIAGQEVGAALALGQQEPRLLEGLAHDGHPVGEAARLDAQQRAGLGVAARRADSASASAPPSSGSTAPPGNT